MEAVKLVELKTDDLVYDMEVDGSLFVVVGIANGTIYLDHISGVNHYSKDETGFYPFPIGSNTDWFKTNSHV